jgi:hypothetical protein
MPDNYLKHKRDNNDRSGYTSVEDSSGNPIFSYLTRRADRALVRFRGTLTFARGIIGGMLQFKKKSDTTKYPSGTNLGLINMNQSFSFRNSTSEVANLDNSGNLQIDGNLTVSGNRKFTVTVSTDDSHSGDVVYFGGGSTTKGNICYLRTDGTWANAQADDVNTSSTLLGIALGTDPDVDGMLLRGMYTLDHDIGNNQGVIVYLSDSAGGSGTVTRPSSSGDIVRIIGYNMGDDDQIWFNPDSTWVEIA